MRGRSCSGGPRVGTDLPMVAPLACLLAALLCIDIHSSPAWAAPVDDVSCYRDERDSSADRSAIEQRCLSKIAKFVERSGNRLSVITADGRKTFDSRPDACEAGRAETCIDTRVVEYIRSLDTVVLERSTYENRDFLLVERPRGKVFEIGDRPFLSPGKAAFVVAMGSEVSEPNGIEIWNRQDGGLQKVWSYYVPTGGYELYSFERWIGSDQIVLNVDERVGADFRTCKVRLRKSDKGWARID